LKKHLVPGMELITFSNIECVNMNDQEVVFNAKRIEEEYNISISFLMSSDRALGQGYLFNVSNVPDIKSASYEHIDKLRLFLRQFYREEIVLNNADILIQEFPEKTRTSIARHRGIIPLSIVLSRYGNRYFWSDDDYQTSSYYLSRIRELRDANYLSPDDNIQYQVHAMGAVRLKKRVGSYLGAMKGALYNAFNDIKRVMIGNFPKDSYYLFGWVPSYFRSVYNYNYVKQHSVSPDELEDFKVVYFTLHIEPEVSLILFSPEFYNTMEAVAWISKSLPSDVLLILKEHPYSYGVRTTGFHKMMNKISNVYWSHPDIDSVSWINRAVAVATITGTVATEAVYHKKPVLSFGKHQAVNLLPSVQYITNYFETKNAIDDIMDGHITNAMLESSRDIAHKALMDSSFELNGYDDIHSSHELQPELATSAINALNLSNGNK